LYAGSGSRISASGLRANGKLRSDQRVSFALPAELPVWRCGRGTELCVHRGERKKVSQNCHTTCGGRLQGGKLGRTQKCYQICNKGEYNGR
jgi:hypothetical protein